MSSSVLVVVGCLVVGLSLVGVALLSPISPWLRWMMGVLGVVVAATPVLVVALFLGGQPEQLEPDDTLAIGLRIEGGEPQIWLGPGCDGVTELRAVLKVEGSPNNDILQLRAEEPGVEVEQFGLTPDAYPRGMEADSPLVPEQLDLGQHRSLTVVQERAAGVLLEPVVSGSADHPGKFWFDESQGWLSPDEALQRAADGKLSTVCEPAPEQ